MALLESVRVLKSGVIARIRGAHMKEKLSAAFWDEKLRVSAMSKKELTAERARLKRQSDEAELALEAFFTAVQEKFGADEAATLRQLYKTDSAEADAYLASLTERASRSLPEPEGKM